MQYRILQIEEWDRLRELIDPSQHANIPYPDAASVAVAEDEDGRLVGCLFLQLALHMEPLVLKDPNVRFDRLHDTLLDAVKENKGLHLYCFSDKEIIDRMANHVGMEPLPYKIFQQVVK